MDESSRSSGQYQDPNYLPFYYHLGRAFDPRRVFFIGLDLGLQVSCLLKGCGTPKSVHCVQPRTESFYSPRLAVSNVKYAAGRRFPIQVRVGDPDDDFLRSCAGVDMALVSHEMNSDSLMECMGLCWGLLAPGGHLCVDRLCHRDSRGVFRDFCKSRGCDSHVFDTRYGSGIAAR